MSTETERLHMRMDRALYDALRRMAYEERTTITEIVTDAVTKYRPLAKYRDAAS